MAKEEKFFRKSKVSDQIWAIPGGANDLMYLVVGSDCALLVDTGMGIGDLSIFVRGMTDLPLMVVNTHGHPDHAGGNALFDEVWLHPADFDLMQKMCSEVFRLRDIETFIGQNAVEQKPLMENLVKQTTDNVRFLREGQIIDLGDRHFEVIHTPGHSPGSVMLLDVVNKVLFAGDTIVPGAAWLFLDHSEPLQTYLHSLYKIRERLDSDTLFLPGHQPTPLQYSHFTDLITCAEQILASPGIGEREVTFAGEGLLWRHGQASILYNPDKIEEKVLSKNSLEN